MRAVGIVLGCGLLLWISSIVLGLRSNIAKAKRSGLPYVVAPCSAHCLAWRLLNPILIPLIVRFLPEAWHRDWLEIFLPNWCYQTGHSTFARLGDSFFVVSPGSLWLLTADANMIHQVTSRREQFPKNVATYGILRVFGENLITAGGDTWKLQRKITSASFTERTNNLVFRESVRQGCCLADVWLNPRERHGDDSFCRDVLHLGLHIISYTGFGLQLLWPGEKPAKDADPRMAKYAAHEAPPGHDFSFAAMLEVLTQRMLTLLVTPDWLLNYWPSETMKWARLVKRDFERYIGEMVDEKIEDSRQGVRIEGMDLIGQLIRSSEAARDTKGEIREARGLTEEEIVGNAFIFLVAGHETTANTMQFILLELATNPASQRRLQQEIDALVGDKEPSEWDYETLLNPMMESMLAACMNESLRKTPPAPEVHKVSAQDQTLSTKGQTHDIPKDTVIYIAIASAHRNPKQWPVRPSKLRPGHNDLDDWVPERWLESSEEHGVEEKQSTVDSGAKRLLRPTRSSFLPFSEGTRVCIGKRTGQIEIVAALAAIFRYCSIELAVDDWANDQEVAMMDRDQKAEVYRQAQERSRETIAGAFAFLTLGLHGTEIPVKVVPRGNERFVNWME